MKINYLLVMILILLFSPIALAHRPLYTSGPASREKPIRVEDHQISWAAYNILSREKEVDYYSFRVKGGEKIYAEMLIPKIEKLKDFYPLIVLIGPELDSNNQNPEIIKLIDLKADEDFIVKEYDQSKKDEVFFEPFTQTRYWIRQKLNIEAPVDGQYFLAVLDPGGQTGKYVLSIGKKEKWGYKDILKMPSIWWNVRMFMERKFSTYIITTIISIGAILLLIKIIKKFFI